MPQSVLSLNNASIFQRENLILSDINITIDKGEFVYLIGKTGTGKSSFMKTLYGDLPLSKGNGAIVGYDLLTLKEKEIYYIIRVNKQHAVLSNIVCGTTCQSGAFR